MNHNKRTAAPYGSKIKINISLDISNQTAVYKCDICNLNREIIRHVYIVNKARGACAETSVKYICEGCLEKLESIIAKPSRNL